ncbi:hypothetical protein GCM10009118_16210 [Wandonia haliotis]|uniref:Uncharacterized protein n=1 Tax=Wandonia haliotis TaxID=574963 RepID=A0ABN1MQK8_9FLAO
MSCQNDEILQADKLDNRNNYCQSGLRVLNGYDLYFENYRHRENDVNGCDELLLRHALHNHGRNCNAVLNCARSLKNTSKLILMILLILQIRIA